LQKLFDAAKAPNEPTPELPSSGEYAHSRSDYVHSGKGTPPPGATPVAHQ
jgi:bacterioferritin-associated ferredoxin